MVNAPEWQRPQGTAQGETSVIGLLYDGDQILSAGYQRLAVESQRLANDYQILANGHQRLANEYRVLANGDQRLTNDLLAAPLNDSVVNHWPRPRPEGRGSNEEGGGGGREEGEVAGGSGNHGPQVTRGNDSSISEDHNSATYVDRSASPLPVLVSRGGTEIVRRIIPTQQAAFVLRYLEPTEEDIAYYVYSEDGDESDFDSEGSGEVLEAAETVLQVREIDRSTRDA